MKLTAEQAVTRIEELALNSSTKVRDAGEIIAQIDMSPPPGKTTLALFSDVVGKDAYNNTIYA